LRACTDASIAVGFVREPGTTGGGREPRRFNRAIMLLLSALGLWIVLQALLGTGFGPGLDDLRTAMPILTRGLALTAYISLVSLLVGSGIAAALVVGLTMSLPALKKTLVVWCTLFRGTPMIAQLYLVYYGAGEIHGALAEAHLWWFFRDPLNCVMFTFTLNTAAYQARIVHGAIANLPREQMDAALALGLPRHVTLLRVQLPQALLTALRPLGNEVSKMTKASAVASLVTVLDLLGSAKYLFSITFDFGFYIIAAVLYVLLIGAIRLGLDLIEQRLSRHLQLAR
jgi:polar amino acid transport system permease protein